MSLLQQSINAAISGYLATVLNSFKQSLSFTKKKEKKALNGGKVLKLAKSAAKRQVEYNSKKVVTEKQKRKIAKNNKVDKVRNGRQD